MSNSTISAHRVGWVSEPDGRGTMSLLYSCFFTIFICTWSAIHMNTPADTDSRIKVFLQKLKWMVIGILAPECVALLAVGEWYDAKYVCKELWPSKAHKDLARGFLITMGGFTIETTDNKRTRLGRHGFCCAVAEGIIERPGIEIEEIEDKNKADWLTKSIACLQIGWLLAQLIGRAAEHTSVTPLEFFTLGIVVCALVTYGFWWKKPFDLRRPVMIKTELDFQTVRGRLAASSEYWKSKEDPLPRISLWGNAGDNLCGKTQKIPYYTMAMVLPILFGSCHLAAWSFAFPTEWEHLLWRVSAVACVILPLLIFFIPLSDLLEYSRYGDLIMYFLLGLYIFVRIFLIFEIFFTLRSVPADIYQSVNWAGYVPHI